MELAVTLDLVVQDTKYGDMWWHCVGGRGMVSLRFSLFRPMTSTTMWSLASTGCGRREDGVVLTVAARAVGFLSSTSRFSI